MNILKLTVSPISTNSSTLNIILSIAHEAIELPTYFMPVLLNKYLNITLYILIESLTGLNVMMNYLLCTQFLSILPEIQYYTF